MLDLGCGSGAQSFYVAELTGGTVVSIDSHRPHIERMRNEVTERGLDARVFPEVGDMGALDPGLGRFDLIWAEGSIYNLGLPRGLEVAGQFLEPGGWFVFTEAVWLAPNPPSDVAAAFADYPAMGTVEAACDAIQRAGFEAVEHFTLPESAWWDDFYTPMESELEAMRLRYASDAEALAIIGALADEPAMRRRSGTYFGYEFFVVRQVARR